MTYYGTTDEMTNINANTYNHFVVNEFSQQKILPDGSTIINIYYDREVFNIKITFEGIEYDSIKYDVDEDVLFNATKTYNLCPIGYNLKECKVNGSIVNNVNDYVIENIDNNYEIDVKVELAKYKVTTPVLQNGDIIVKGSRRNILCGEMKTFEVVAHEGYKLKNVYVNGKPIETDNGKFTIFVTENLSINAEFESIVQPLSIFDSPIVLIPLGLTALVFGAILIKVLIDRRRFY